MLTLSARIYLKQSCVLFLNNIYLVSCFWTIHILCLVSEQYISCVLFLNNIYLVSCFWTTHILCLVSEQHISCVLFLNNIFNSATTVTLGLSWVLASGCGLDPGIRPNPWIPWNTGTPWLTRRIRSEHLVIRWIGHKFKIRNEVEYTLSSRLRGIQNSSHSILK